ncbi:hypothetical protein [Egbenema bharatensis]|uniref:hypothetical protein n=1 Tax=Egbenema bharatensis TaxID=3463334 RepID=UPI003A8BD3C0
MSKTPYEQDSAVRSRQPVRVNDSVKYCGHNKQSIERFHDDILRVVFIMPGEVEVVHGSNRHWLSRSEIEVIA